MNNNLPSSYFIDDDNYHVYKCECGNLRRYKKLSYLKRSIASKSKCSNCVNKRRLGLVNGCMRLALYRHAVRNAKSRGFDFELSPEYLSQLLIDQDFKCKLSNLPIDATLVKFKATASIDRIDSKKGYVKGNVQWLHKRVNMSKGSMRDDEFIEMCRLVSGKIG